MPSDALTVAVTTGLGVSVLAGILSGICYILTHGLPNTRVRTPITPWHCNVCGQQFRSIQGILEVEKVVTCARCRTKVCRVRCSKRDPRKGWICQTCQKPENWFKGLLKSIHPNKDWGNNSMDPDAGDELDEELMELRKREREQVRDFIEKLVEAMLGANLDDVSVSRVYNDKNYLPITGQSPCSAHAYLKQLIQRFATEAADLPSLSRNEDHPGRPEETISNRTYEDLLSTAIINRVVQTNQNDERSAGNSSRASTATGKSSGNKEYFFGEETLESKWKNRDDGLDDASSVSSLDDWVRSDSSVASSKYVDRVSLTIKQHIEEGSSSGDESLDNTPQSKETPFPDSTDDWHENWYFQKRRLTSSNSPVPVPMLVPNPITEAKVLIGDKEAEELSDIDSDYGDPEVVPDIKNILVNSKTIIGGKNAVTAIDETDNMIPLTEDIVATSVEEVECREDECRSDQVSQVETGLRHEVPQEVNVEEVLTTNECPTEKIQVLDIPEPCNENASLMSIESNIEQDTEYTEQYASLPKTFLKHSMPISRKLEEMKQCGRNEAVFLENGFTCSNKESEDVKSSDTTDLEDDLKVFKGSYSEREKEKWKHSSVDIPDNPYSPENLERRLSSRSSNESSSSIYGRDYYIRNAAKSAGARSPAKILDGSESLDDSPVANGIEDNSHEVTFTAVPAIVTAEESNEFESTSESTVPTLSKPIFAHDISSDSDLSIERVYNLQSGKVFEKKGNVTHEISTKDPYSPEGLKYMPKEFDEDIRYTITDENHNNTKIENKKQAFMRSLTQDENEDPENVVNNIDVEISLVEEQIITDTVPYDENKFKATLEKFKIDQIVVSDKKIETSSKINSPIENNVQPPSNINSDAIDSKINLENTDYFGEAEKLIDGKINTSDYSEEEILSDSREFSLEYSTDMYGDDVSKAESSLETDPEIIDLKEKRLVKDILGKLSKSYPNISITSMKSLEDQTAIDFGKQSEEQIVEKSLLDEVDVIPSVKNLKQLFDKGQNSSPIKKDSKQIYSLTARSLSVQIREQLRSDEETSFQTSFQQEENLSEHKTPEEETIEVLPADIAKNMIAFYEHLQNKK